MQTKGPCTYCDRSMTRGGMARHLGKCPHRQERIIRAANESDSAATFLHVQAQDAGTGLYWLHLEIAASASMRTLDAYLRSIWLECCGHGSEWSVGSAWRGRTVPMSAKASAALRPGVNLVHVYDFGTTTQTDVKLVGARTGAATTSRPITLMARNDAPPIPCMECEDRAEWLCMQCVYEFERDGGLCPGHAAGHPHEDYGELMPVVNSPRVGMCGYTGPAEPPR
jgi:hypothetical protein